MFKKYRKFIIIGVVLMFVGSLAGEEGLTSEEMSGDTSNKEVQTENVGSENNTDKETEKVVEEKVSLKVNSINEEYKDSYLTPSAGYHYVHINYDITNNGVEDGLDLNSLYLSLETNAASYNNFTFVTDSNLVMMDTSSIKPGISKTFDVVFEVPDGEVLDLLVFKPMLGNSAQVSLAK